MVLSSVSYHFDNTQVPPHALGSQGQSWSLLPFLDLSVVSATADRHGKIAFLFKTVQLYLMEKSLENKKQNVYIRSTTQ